MAEVNLKLGEDFQDEIERIVKRSVLVSMQELEESQSRAKDFMSKKECAEWLGISFNTLSEWCNLGLKTIQVQGKHLIAKKDVLEFLENYKK